MLFRFINDAYIILVVVVLIEQPFRIILKKLYIENSCLRYDYLRFTIIITRLLINQNPLF